MIEAGKFKTVTPVNIQEMTIEEAMAFVPVDHTPNIPNKQVRLNLLKALYKIQNYQLSPDTALALVSDVRYKLILAPAGGGKSTQVTLDTVKTKILHHLIHGEKLYGKRILALVYNGHNVKPLKALQARMVSRVSGAIEGVDLDREIDAYTLHSFVYQWILEYADELGIRDFGMLSDSASLEYLRSSWGIITKAMNITGIIIDFNAIFKLYNYAINTMQEYTSLEVRDKFPEITLDDELLQKLFDVYEARKKRAKRLNFTDQLRLAHKLFVDNPEALARVRRNYDYFIADEIQDFTPLMMALLRLLVGDKPLTAIGDEDQTIYGFLGADVNNVLKFPEMFEGGQVYVLNNNRRCAANITRLGEKVIMGNNKRFNKRIVPVRGEGEIELIPYSSEEGQIMNIVQRIERMSLDERQNVAICYRDKIYSTLLTEMLESKGIAFHILSGYEPFSHELFGHVIDVLDMLYDPADRQGHLNLYKVLPITKLDLYDVLGYDPAKRQFSTDDVRVHFRSNDYGKFSTRTSFRKGMEVLLEAVPAISKYPLKAYFPVLFEMICKNFWDYKKDSINTDIEYDSLFTQRVKEFFMSDKTYAEFSEDLARRRSTIKSWREAESGVTVSTFHGLKGLEFDHVFMTYMDAAIFPNLETGTSNATEEELLEVQEGETRLAYVGVTRAKNKLSIYYRVDNPSPYVHQIMEFLENEGVAVDIPPEVKNPVVHLGQLLEGPLDLNDSNPKVSVSGMKEFKGGSFLGSVLNKNKS